MYGYFWKYPSIYLISATCEQSFSKLLHSTLANPYKRASLYYLIKKLFLSLQSAIIRALLCWANAKQLSLAVASLKCLKQKSNTEKAETAWVEWSACIQECARSQFSIHSIIEFSRQSGEAGISIAPDMRLHANHMRERERKERIHISAVCKHEHTQTIYSQTPHRSVECAPQERHARSPDSAARPVAYIHLTSKYRELRPRE